MSTRWGGGWAGGVIALYFTPTYTPIDFSFAAYINNFQIMLHSDAKELIYF